MGRGVDVGSGALAGAGTGAALGSMVLPGYGTAIGAGLGGLAGGVTGWFAGGAREEGEEKSRSAILEARKRLEALAAQQRTQREMDLTKALSYFAPVQAEMSRLYNRPTGPTAAAPPSPMAPRPSALGGNNTAAWFAGPSGRRGIG